MNKRIKYGFSLVEVLISVLIISIVLILAVPAISKRAPRTGIFGGSAGFYYDKANSAGTGLACYRTALSEDGTQTIVKDDSGNCEVHEFVVPSGVHTINLTLVAGGGGGGGAAGGTVYRKNFASTEGITLENIPQERLKSAKIEFMTGSGESGKSRSTAASTSYVYAGQGGASGVAIANFEVPRNYIKAYYTPDFTSEGASLSNLSYINSGNLAVLGTTFNTIDVFNGIGLLFDVAGKNDAVGLYVADAPVSSTGTSLQCFRGLSDGENVTGVIGYYKNGVDDGLNAACSLTPTYYKLSVPGKTSALSNTGIEVGSGYVVHGGEGGRQTDIKTGMGAGGKGQSAVILCPGSAAGASQYCAIPNNNSSGTSASATRIKTIPAETITPASSRYGNTIVSLEHPGGVGGGGAGGSAVKINDFPVIPGAKYKIVVGGGGAAGAKGTGGILLPNGSYINSPTQGANGLGGSSTAIYDNNNNLVMMVIGGAGGYGGKINQAAVDEIPAGDDFEAYLPLPALPNAARNVPLLILGSGVASGDLSFDTTVVSSVVQPAANSLDLADGLSGLRIVYAYVNNRNIPVFELNSNLDAVANGTTVSSNEANYNKTGGFSAYKRGNDVTLASLSLTPGMAYGGINSPGSLYNGLFFRYSLNDAFAYPGGLGGFSGLGSKAGCGGLFAGNKDGILSTGTVSGYADNTFIVNVNGTNRIFNINDFYGNCSTETSDGQTAKFVPPLYSAIGGEKSGQGGAGGGGGGWNQDFGPGNGGDGQNGYVFITWKTK